MPAGAGARACAPPAARRGLASTLLCLPLLLPLWPDGAGAQTTYTASISMATTAAAEGGDGATAAYPIEISVPDYVGGFVVDVCMTGTATLGTDYELIDEVGGDWAIDSSSCIKGGLSIPKLVADEFRLRPIGDTTVEPNETVILTISRHTNTPSNVTISPTMGSVTFTIRNDDSTGPGVTLSKSSIALIELSATSAEQTYTVKLNTDPGSGETITVMPTSADTTSATVAPTSLAFTGGGSGNWASAQTVTVTALNDDDTANETFNITHPVSGASTGTPYESVTGGNVALTVNDAGKGVIAGVAALDVPNGDGTATYTLRLESPPGGTVTVTPASADTSKATVSAPVSFTDNNWKTPQTVTVTGKGSSTDAVDITHSITTATTEYTASLTLPRVAVSLVAGAPTVTISGVPATSSTGFYATLTVSETPTGFTMADVQVSNGALLPHDFYQPDSANKPLEWVALVAPAATGVVTITVPANAFTNAGGVGNLAASATSTYTAPTTTAVPTRTVPLDWALKPGAISAGQSFRLLFITDVWRDATSHDIADYDTYVQTRAAAGHTAIRPYGSDFRVLGSTATVAAIDHLGATGTGVPIYWLNGAKVADNYTGFWDNSWDAQAGTDRRNAAGQQSNSGTRSDWPWTGTQGHGARHDRPLGSSLPRRGGSGAGPSPISHHFGITAPRTANHAFYALSPLFTATTTGHTLSISMATTQAPEGQAGATATYPITFPLAPARSTSFKVDLCLTGTATHNTDYQVVDDLGQTWAFDNSGCLTGGLDLKRPTDIDFQLKPLGDTTDETDETVILTLSRRTDTPADITISPTMASVTFTMQDDDSDGVSLSRSALALTELHATDATGTYTVRLNTDPGSGNTVTVTPASADTSAATVAPTTPLSFTGGSGGTWNTAQTVTVTALNARWRRRTARQYPDDRTRQPNSWRHSGTKHYRHRAARGCAGKSTRRPGNGPCSNCGGRDQESADWRDHR